MEILMELNFVDVNAFGRNFKASWRKFLVGLGADFYKKSVEINIGKDGVKRR